MRLLSTIRPIFSLIILLSILLFSTPIESFAQTKGKSSSSRKASNRKNTKLAKARARKGSGKKVAARKKVSTKGKAGKTSVAARRTPKPATATEPTYTAPRGDGMPNPVAYSSSRSYNPEYTSAPQNGITPTEQSAMRSRLEKSDQEMLQEIFGFDANNQDTAFTSAYWLGQMRFSMTDPVAKVFGDTKLYENGRSLTMKEMDATQRVLPMSRNYEGYVVTPHADASNFYLFLYDKNRKRMLSVPQKIAYENVSPTNKHRLYSYVFEDKSTGKVKILSCVKSIRADMDTCTMNCQAEYRLEGLEFDGNTFQTKFIIQQSRRDAKVTSSFVSCGDAALRQNLNARAESLITYYFRKRE